MRCRTRGEDRYSVADFGRSLADEEDATEAECNRAFLALREARQRPEFRFEVERAETEYRPAYGRWQLAYAAWSARGLAGRIA